MQDSTGQAVRPNSAENLLEFGLSKLSSLWRVVMNGDCPQEIRALFKAMNPGLEMHKLGVRPEWPSDITDDHTPFEFSVIFGGARPELRFLVEAQGSQPTPTSTREAGLRLNQTLQEMGAYLGNAEKLIDLFLPDSARGRFAIWHSMGIQPGGPASFKIYLNPQCAGPENSFALVEEALDRLGMKGCISAIFTAARRSPPRDEIRYISLDLSEDSAARVKVYLYLHNATEADIEHACSVAQGYRPGKAAAFFRSIVGTEDSLSGAAPAICLAFVAGQDVPKTATLHLPVRFLSQSDQQICDRVSQYMQGHGMWQDAEKYKELMLAYANRPLSAGVGLQSYVSLREDRRGARLAVYLAPEAHSSAAVPEFRPPAPLLYGPPELIVEHYACDVVTAHPFFQRLSREPVNLWALWCLLINIRAAMARPFTRRLANVISRVEDVHIRSYLAKQLNDELGNGDGSQAHSLLFDRLVDGVAPFGAERETEQLLGPSVNWKRRLDALYSSPDVWEGIGASIVVELVGQQADTFITNEFRRQDKIPKAALEWLELHETLEIEHSRESLEISHLVPHEGSALVAVWRGAHECRACCWAFLDEMYRLLAGIQSDAPRASHHSRCETSIPAANG